MNKGMEIQTTWHLSRGHLAGQCEIDLSLRLEGPASTMLDTEDCESHALEFGL